MLCFLEKSKFNDIYIFSIFRAKFRSNLRTNKMKVSLMRLIFCTTVTYLMATVSVESSSQHLCENGTTYINGSELSVCFYLVDVALGTMNQTDATQRCDEHYPGSTVVALTDKVFFTIFEQ